jgi:hypothetical protein
MPIRQRVVTYGVSTAAAATLTVAALLHPWRGAPAPTYVVGPAVELPNGPRQVPSQVPSQVIDLVFAVDTTSSMGGLLDGAKRTVWSIATHLRKTEPNAALRIGLVAYRDIGDAYVTRDFALTSDLDAVFAELSSYQAAGGGDTPEDVAAALDDTLHKMQWRGDARKLVFLVGDAPPANRGDVPSFDVLAREAGARQIVLNTIRCGDDPNTQVAWQQIAQLGHGEFSTIRQDGGVQQIATPYDAKLGELSAAIDGTAVILGDDKDRAGYDRNLVAARAAPVAAQAERAAYYSMNKPGAGTVANDLVGGVEAGTMAVEALPEASLPADLRGLAKPALKAEIAQRAQRRKAAQRELAKLSQDRDAYLKANATDAGDAFDTQVNAALDRQLKSEAAPVRR